MNLNAHYGSNLLILIIGFAAITILVQNSYFNNQSYKSPWQNINQQPQKKNNDKGAYFFWGAIIFVVIMIIIIGQ